VPSSPFVQYAHSENLPNLSIVAPGGTDAAFSEHNGLSITVGDDWLGQVASTVMNGPEWRSTVLFITWDDCGCLYDQVRPGVKPDGTAQGPRVPLVIVSPYAKPGYTETTATTFAGILAYAEQNFGLAARRERFADLPIRQRVQIQTSAAPARANDLPPLAARCLSRQHGRSQPGHLGP
jgi:phospholipase C